MMSVETAPDRPTARLAHRAGPPSPGRASPAGLRLLAGDGPEAEAVIAVHVLGIAPHGPVDRMGIVTDEDAPLPGAHPVEDDRRRLLGRHRRVIAEYLAEHPHHVLDVLVRQPIAGKAATRHLLARLGEVDPEERAAVEHDF